MSSQMVTLIVAGMGILGTLLAPLLNGWQNRQSERQKWARESKIEAYAAFAAKAEETGRRILHHPHFGLYSPEDLAQMTESHRSQTQVNLDTQLADWDELLTAFNKVILFGSMPVMEAAGALLGEIREFGDLKPLANREESHARNYAHHRTFADRLAGFHAQAREDLGLHKL